MTRDELLKDWKKYPAASSDWSDVRMFKGEGWVAGRIAINNELESGGANLKLPAHTFPLLPGDLVAAEIRANKIVNFLLLFPTVNGERWTANGERFSVSRSEQWSLFLSAIRLHFLAKHFIEAQTPTLVPSPGTEPFLDPFSTEWFIGSHKQTLYLPTSPEFHLKQMLVKGWTRIFEMKPCFRNGEIGEHHQPEFLMLEWYRAYNNLNTIADDVDDLLQALAKQFGVNAPKVKRTTIAQLFSDAFGGFQLTPFTTKDELIALAKQNSIATSEDDSFDDVFFRLFLEKIEHKLGAGGPLLVSLYPPSQAALSRIGEHGWAERFEVYWNGLELANAFHELNDPVENEKRFAEDAKNKNALGKPAVPRDENLVSALKTGMPPSGGIALGVDRLFMALFGIEKIEDTRAFPLTRR